MHKDEMFLLQITVSIRVKRTIKLVSIILHHCHLSTQSPSDPTLTCVATRFQNKDDCDLLYAVHGSIQPETEGALPSYHKVRNWCCCDAVCIFKHYEKRVFVLSNKFRFLLHN